MTGLVETLPRASRAQLWSRRAALAFAMCAFVGLVAWAGFNLSRSSSGAAHQIAKIALLPDMPPPPPPPPPPERPKIEPKNEIKQQIDKPKQETPPEPEQLKMEGKAGEGPSPFAAGEVKNDYIGGDIGNGRFMPYVGHITQLIQDALTRRKAKIASARMLLWLSNDGAVERFEISGAGPDAERELRTALADLGHAPEKPPPGMPMPLGLEISSR
jgi:periplasmic protein TonB